MKFPYLHRFVKKTEDDLTCHELQRRQLLTEMKNAKYAMDAAYSNFDNVTDPELIDRYIYEVNTILKRYKFLIEEAAKLNLLPDSITYSLYEETSTAASIIQIDA